MVSASLDGACSAPFRTEWASSRGLISYTKRLHKSLIMVLEMRQEGSRTWMLPYIVE